MEGERHFHLNLLSLYTVLYFLSFILELCQNAKCQTEKTIIKYSKAELLNLKPQAHATRMDTGICDHIKNQRIKQNF